MDVSAAALEWGSTYCPNLLIEMDMTDNTFAHVTTSVLVNGNQGPATALFPGSMYVVGKQMYTQTWYRLTPSDAIGAGTPVILSYIYSPALNRSSERTRLS